MPIVTLPKADQFQSANFTADFSDENFGFLAGFEEFIPESTQVQKKGKKGSRKNENVGKAESLEKPDQVEKSQQPENEVPSLASENKKKKRNRNKRKNKKSDATKDSEGQQQNPRKKKEKMKGKMIKLSSVTEIEEDTSEVTEEVEKSEVIEKNVKAKTKRDKRKEKENKKKEQGTKRKVQFAEHEKEISKKRVKKETVAKSDDQEEEKDVDFDMSDWADFYLPEPILKALKKLKFGKATEIQKQVLSPAVRDRVDILGAAETGSGKTLAFSIPVISRILTDERDGNGPRAFIIAPTRELVVQIKKVLDSLCQFTAIKSVCIVGGLAEEKQLRVMAKSKPEIVVATPGRLWDLMQNTEKCQYLTELEGVQCLVVDETDRMVEQGHFRELKHIISAVKSKSTHAKNEKLQTLVFSATLTYVLPAQKTKELSTKEKIKYLLEETGIRKQHKVVDVCRSFGTAEKLVETRMNCNGLLEKDTNVVYLLNRYKGRTLIFTNSVDASRRLYGILGHLKMNPMMLHANMIQRQRLRNLEKFAGNENSVLLATDVAARGLDIKGIEHVIHYQVPKTAEMYIHRSGRTARASETGLTVLMVDPKDAHLYRKICKNLNRANDLPVFPVDSLSLKSALMDRVKLASDLDVLLYRAKKIRLTEDWFAKAAREADLTLDDRYGEIEQANHSMNELLLKQDRVKEELRVELMKPLPNIHSANIIKSKYITPEIAASYDKKLSEHALEDLELQLNSIKELKKKNRVNVKSHNLKPRKFKK